MIIQLNPALPMRTPKGEGFAHFLIDYSQEHHLLWVVFLDESGECWTFTNREVRAVPNASLAAPRDSQLLESIADLEAGRGIEHPLIR